MPTRANSYFRIAALILALVLRSDVRRVFLASDQTLNVYMPARRTFFLHLEAGTSAHLSVDQHDVDLAVSYRLPGKNWTEVDSYEYGEESITISTEADATIPIELSVKILHSDDAHYTLRAAKPHPSSRDDQLWVEAERLATNVKRSLSHLRQDSLRELNENQRVVAIWRGLNAPKLEAASIVQSGNICFRQGKLSDAEGAYADSADLAKQHNDAANIAESLNNLGYIELLLGQLDHARKHLIAALDVSTGAGSKYGRLSALNNLALLEWQTGDFASARRKYLQALELVSQNDRQTRATLLNNLGLIFRSLGDYDEAIYDLSTSLDLLPPGETTARARTMINLARAYLLSNRVETSIKWLKQALPLAHQSSDPHALADGLNTRGQDYAEIGQLSAAETDLRNAANLYKEVRDQRGYASALHHLGLVLADRNEFQASLNLLDQALKLRLLAGLRDDVADTLFALARVSLRTGNLTNARTYSARTLTMIESLRAGIPGESFRLSYFSSKQSFYDFYVDLLMEMYRQNPKSDFDREAFKIAEHAHGRAMVEILRESRAAIERGVDPVLLFHERRAGQRLGFVSGEVLRMERGALSSSQEADLRAQLQRAIEDYRRVETDIRDQSPQYANLIWPAPRTLLEIRRVLDNNTVLLEYSLGKLHSYLWLIDSKSFSTFELPGETTLEPLSAQMGLQAADYRARLRNPGLEGSYQQTVMSLSRILVGPVSRYLKGKKILIVASGILQRVPFAALRISGTKGLPLGVTHEIVRMTSASAFVEMREQHRRRVRPPPGVAVFADPVFDLSDPRVPQDKRLKGAADPALARLPFTRIEAQEIIALFPTDKRISALGFDASRENLFRVGIAKFRYIHFGTHAIIDQEPEVSGIALSSVTRDGKRVDGFIRLADIYNLPPLSCDLVVLAGCDTGAGRDQRGEGLIGLTRGFLYAGARSALINLWALDDSPWTAETMKSLYTALANGRSSPGSALRSAREALWQRGGRWRDDYFLAGLEIYGEDD